MDNLELYIKMCDCPEIQDRWKERNFDMFPALIYDKTVERICIAIWMPKRLAELVNPESNCMAVSIEYNRDKDIYVPPGEYSFDNAIWLPRQEDLQKMSGLDWRSFDRKCLVYEHPILVPTKEQAGIRVVMKEKFGKTWCNEEWVFVKDDELDSL